MRVGKITSFRCKTTEESKRFWNAVDKAASKAPKKVITRINDSYQRNISKIESENRG